jgi:hypothetical protein
LRVVLSALFYAHGYTAALTRARSGRYCSPLHAKHVHAADTFIANRKRCVDRRERSCWTSRNRSANRPGRGRCKNTSAPGVKLHRHGVRIIGAIIDEPIDLENAQIRCEVWLDHCQFNENVTFARANFAGGCCSMVAGLRKRQTSTA